MPARNSGSGQLRPDPLLASLFVCVWFDVTLVATPSAVQLGERVGAKLEYAVLHTVALVFAAAHFQFSFFCRPTFRGQPSRERPRSQTKPKCIVGGPALLGFWAV